MPLLIATGIFTVMTTWSRGRQLLSAWMKERTISIEEFIALSDIEHAPRVPGTAVFLTSSTTGVPGAEARTVAGAGWEDGKAAA